MNYKLSRTLLLTPLVLATTIDFDAGAGVPTLVKAGANPIQANLTVSEPSAPE